MKHPRPYKAAFFDRDGTLIEDVSYLSRIADVKLLPEAVRIAQLCQQQGYLLFVITNQSGVARGMYDENFVHETNQYVARLFAQHGVQFKDFYFCPHHPTNAVTPSYQVVCDCRKPKPGMLLQAAQDYSIDLSQSILFGNEARDLQAGVAAGCRSVFDITKLFALPSEQCATLW